MFANNCRYCGKLFKITASSGCLCSACRSNYESQYRARFKELEKFVSNLSFREVNKRIGRELHRVQVYLAFRFSKISHPLTLEGYRRGHCYICYRQVHLPVRDIVCLDCLQTTLSILRSGDLDEAHKDEMCLVIKQNSSNEMNGGNQLCQKLLEHQEQSSVEPVVAHSLSSLALITKEGEVES